MRAVLVERESAPQNFVDDFGIVSGVAATNCFEWRAAQSEIFRHDGVAAHRAIAQFGDGSFAAYGNFIQAIRAMNHQRALNAQFAESLGHQFGETCVIYADDLRGSS